MKSNGTADERPQVGRPCPLMSGHLWSPPQGSSCSAPAGSSQEEVSQGSETKLGGEGGAGKVTGGRGREENGVERTIETQVKTALRRAKMGREEENKYEKKEGGRERERERERKWSGGFRQDVCVEECRIRGAEGKIESQDRKAQAGRRRHPQVH